MDVILCPLFVFDVESVGPHGEGFAAGWIVTGLGGLVHEAGACSCPPDRAGDPAGRARVAAHSDLLSTHPTPADVRAAFWARWEHWRRLGAWLVADRPWPAEARFLLDCVRDDPGRAALGPDLLVDVASVRLAAGLDPMAAGPRRPDELPAHDPLANARHSARLLLEALGRRDGGAAGL